MNFFFQYASGDDWLKRKFTWDARREISGVFFAAPGGLAKTKVKSISMLYRIKINLKFQKSGREKLLAAAVLI